MKWMYCNVHDNDHFWSWGRVCEWWWGGGSLWTPENLEEFMSSLEEQISLALLRDLEVYRSWSEGGLQPVTSSAEEMICCSLCLSFAETTVYQMGIGQPWRVYVHSRKKKCSCLSQTPGGVQVQRLQWTIWRRCVEAHWCIPVYLLMTLCIIDSFRLPNKQHSYPKVTSCGVYYWHSN